MRRIKQTLILNTVISCSCFCFCFYHYLQILVIFCVPGVVKLNVIRSVVTQIVNKETLSGLILIVQNHLTTQALKAVDQLPFKAEIFQVCLPSPFMCKFFPCYAVVFSRFRGKFRGKCVAVGTHLSSGAFVLTK